MTYDPNNVFAKIIERAIPANIVLENDKCIAFHDIHPEAPVHVLIVPKVQCIDFEDFIAKETDCTYFFRFILEVAAHLNLTEYKLVTNKGASAGQSVFHFHVHLMA